MNGLNYKNEYVVPRTVVIKVEMRQILADSPQLELPEEGESM